MAESSGVFHDSQQEMIDYLNLQDNPDKDRIISDLFRQGWRSFCDNTLSRDILSKVKSFHFAEIMTQHLRETMETGLDVIDVNIKKFYDDEKEDDRNRLNTVLTRLAENGYKHTKSSSKTLFFVIELTFPWIGADKDVAANLWIYLTTDGLDGLKNCSDYISPETLNELLYEDEQSPLYLALRHYYENELKELSEKYLQNIVTKGFFDLAIDSAARSGWLEGVKTLSKKIPPIQFHPFWNAVSDMVEKWKSEITLQTSPYASSVPSIEKEPSPVASPAPVSISQQIDDYLQLHDNPKRDEIISAILANGRQALFQYQKDVKPDLFSIEKGYVLGQKDTHLMKLLQEYVYETLKNISEQSSPTLFALLQVEKKENALRFNAVERKLAENGIEHRNASFVLSFVLQYLFHDVEDTHENVTDIFNQLFERVTHEGTRGTTHFEEYIAKDYLDNQINDDQSLLQNALRMYFNDEVEQLFTEYGILNINDLHDLFTQNIMKVGWIAAIEESLIRNKIPLAKYKKIHTLIHKTKALPAAQLEDPIPSDSSATKLSNEQLQSNLEELTKENELLKEQCKQLQLESDTFTAKCESEKNEIQCLKEEMNRLKKNDLLLEEEKKQFSKTTESLKEENQQLKEQIERLKRPISVPSITAREWKH